MGNAEKLRAVLIKQRKKTASARLHALLKAADDPVPRPAAATSTPSRGALMAKPKITPPAAVAAPPPFASTTPPSGFNTNLVAPRGRVNVPPVARPPIAIPGNAPTIGAPNTPRGEGPAVQQARSNYQAAQQRAMQQKLTPQQQQAKQEEAIRYRYDKIYQDSRMRDLALAMNRGHISPEQFQEATRMRPMNVSGTLGRLGQGLEAANAAFGAGYRGLYDYMAGGGTEAGETAKKLRDSIGSHLYGMRTGRNPGAMAEATTLAAQGIPLAKRHEFYALSNDYAANQKDTPSGYSQANMIAAGINPESVFRSGVQKLQSGSPQFTPQEKAEMLQRATTYDTAKADEREQQERDPLFHGGTEEVLSNMGDTGWTLAIPGANASSLRAVSNAGKAWMLPRGLLSPARSLSQNLPKTRNVLDRLADLTGKGPVARALSWADDFGIPIVDAAAAAQTANSVQKIQDMAGVMTPLQPPTDHPELAAAEQRALAAKLRALEAEQLALDQKMLDRPERLSLPQTPEGARNFYEPPEQAPPFRMTANTVENQPILDAQGKPTGSTQQVYKITHQDDSGKMLTDTVPVVAADAAGITPYLSNKAELPDVEQLSQQSSELVSRHPLAADTKASLNITGQAPPNTADTAAGMLERQGKDKDQIQALMDWWGEPGNIATTLGVGASAIGLLMMFMGGQDGLMGWLMPALGITMAAGGLGTLGYQGMFGKNVQDTIKGVANPAMKQLGGIAYDAGWVDRNQFWGQAAKALEEEPLEKLKGSFNIVGRQLQEKVNKQPKFLRWAAEKLNQIPTVESISDAQILEGLKTQDPEAYKMFTEIPAAQAKADVLKHWRGIEELPLGQLQAASQAQTGNTPVPPSYGAQPVE
jgi:hypothetical protein